MDSELPHCTICLRQLPAGWLCKEHKMDYNLLELAARCEAATGADRLPMERLCWEIWIATNEPKAKLEGNGSDRGWQVRLGGSPLGGGKIIKFGSPPAYIASLDAAMTLVPEGLSFEVRRSGTGDKGQAMIWDPMRRPGDREWRVTGCKSPALALCAAALRARGQA